MGRFPAIDTQGQRLTGMTADQKKFPLAGTVFNSNNMVSQGMDK